MAAKKRDVNPPAAPPPKRRSRAKATAAGDGAGKAALVVVESPTKAKTIGKYLGRGYTVKATVGHVRDLPQRELGVDVDKGFAPKYVTIKGKAKTLSEIKKAAKTSDRVLIATDPDREGEAIAWHVAEQLGNGGKVRRVLFHEITKEAVAQALANPVDIDQKKVDAQQARRILDRLVGYKASPLLWKSLKTGLSAGRVQTVALRLIVEREEGIRKFVPQEYWTIEADLEKDGQVFQARLHKLDGHKPEIKDAASAQAIVDAVGKLPFVVSDVTRKERKKRPPAPFTTSTLQQEAAKQLGFSAKRTMRAAQALYEGQDVGAEGPVGLITYMRTDSTRVADSAIAQARDFIKAQFDERYLPATPNVYGGTRGQSRVQDAHEAIRPTDAQRRPEDLKDALEADLFKLYQLIWRRFVASQMNPAVYETTTVDFDLGRYLFRATGSRVVFDGYHVLYHEAHEPEEGKSLDDLAPIPALARADHVTVQKITPNQHFTEPPPRFSEASLVKELERLGIGRPSTYATIISTLQTRSYVTTKDRRFTPTDLGETVCRIMVRLFPDTFDVGFTAQMETELDKVEEGDLGWQQVLGDFWTPFSKALGAVDLQQLIRETHDLSKLHLDKCPNCGSELVVKSGRFGPFIACTRYPECRFTKPLRRDKVPDRPTNEICRECGAPMVIKTGRYGEFLACTRYPACKHTRPVPLGIKCPKCGEGDLAERRTRKGRSFFGCLRYPECDYSVWNRPVAVPCPNCGFVGMEQRQTKAMGAYRKCLKCAHEVPLAETAPVTAEPAAT
ncbi:MAG: type I DNA topoisomerase [Gemmatimonadetes bacterium]|nr:MAG: type I DNA topoisomerase [Gemmatimonadota bacterium]